MPRSVVEKLTEDQWREVFLYRCRKQRGEVLEAGEVAIVGRAFEEDFGRYAAMFPDILGAVDPAYAAARAKMFPHPLTSSQPSLRSRCPGT
jgi:hypothetical protein